MQQVDAFNEQGDDAGCPERVDGKATQNRPTGAATIAELN